MVSITYINYTKENIMNSVSITGRLGQDPELHHTSNSTPVTNLNVANNTGFGENRQTHWLTVVCWKGQAEAVATYLKKGSQVAVNGRLTTRKWEDRDGNTRYATEIIANTVDFLDPPGAVRPPDREYDQGNPVEPPDAAPISEDDIPF